MVWATEHCLVRPNTKAKIVMVFSLAGIGGLVERRDETRVAEAGC